MFSEQRRFDGDQSMMAATASCYSHRLLANQVGSYISECRWQASENTKLEQQINSMNSYYSSLNIGSMKFVERASGRGWRRGGELQSGADGAVAMATQILHISHIKPEIKF